MSYILLHYIRKKGRNCGVKRCSHLRLVSSNSGECKIKLRERVTNYFNDIFVSRNEKIYVLKDTLLNIYRDYELTTGIDDIPYFIKAENKIRQIIKEDKINYYYNRLKKFRKHVSKL